MFACLMIIAVRLIKKSLLLPCSGLVGSTEIPNWELGISVFSQWFVSETIGWYKWVPIHFLVHKIHWQLKLYHCNALLYTYIQQNNQKVEEKQNKFTNKIAFPVDDVTFRLSMCFAKPRISEWDFPHSMSPDSISEWKIWYFRNFDDWRTPRKLIEVAILSCLNSS